MLHLQSFKNSYAVSRPHQLTSSQFHSGAYHRSPKQAGDDQGGDVSDGPYSGNGEDDMTIGPLKRGTSEERINASFHVPLKIYQKREVEITSTAIDGK